MARTCSVQDCARLHKARGYCLSHYRAQVKLAGFATRAIANRSMTLAERFAFIGWDVQPEGCWRWRGSILNGYGRIGRNHSGDTLAHRVSYLVNVGPIPDGLFVHHICANRACVNPGHLQLTTTRANMGEMMLRGYYERHIAALEAEVATLRADLESRNGRNQS
jgi:hypothetical protein